MEQCKQIVKPSKAQYEWHEKERLMFVHFDPTAWQLEGEYDSHTVPLSAINPDKLDTDQWCEAAVSWGAKMIIYVAKHCGGFCWWQTETSEYSIKNTPYKDGKGDVLRQLSESCKKYGLNLGVYIYPGDDTWGAYMGGKGRTSDPSKQAAYNEVYRQQLAEVLGRYGEMKEVWFDGSVAIPVEDIVKKYAPNAVVFQGPFASVRWCGNEGGEIPYPSSSAVDSRVLKTGVSTAIHSNPDGDAWAGLEVDTTLYNHYWFWSEEKAKKRKSLENLMDCYYKSAGRGGNLLLNSSPTTTGLISEEDMALYRSFGNEINRRFSTPLMSTKGHCDSLVLEFNKPTQVNHSVIMEEYEEGERIRGFAIDAMIEGKWHEVYSGSLVGHKHIAVFETVTVSAMRITITDSGLPPLIRDFSAYNVTNVDITALIDRLKGKVRVEDTLRTVAAEWNTGSFKDGYMDIDLSKGISMAGQHRVQIWGKNRTIPHITSAVLYLEGHETDDMVTRGDENSFIVYRSAVVTENTSTVLRIYGTCPDGAEGSITVSPH